MTSITHKVESQEGMVKALSWVSDMATKGLKAGPVVITLGREARTLDQNKKSWALFRDISEQVEWCGQKLSEEDWKDLLTALFEKQRIVPGIDGGLVALGGRTSKYSKERFSEFIEQVYSVGTDKGVIWSDPAIAVYEQYKKQGE